MGENLREPSLLAQNPRLNSPRIAAFWREIAAQRIPLSNSFLVQVVTSLFGHVVYLESSFVARISLDLGFKSLAYL